jgi:hypothetical protein
MGNKDEARKVLRQMLDLSAPLHELQLCRGPSAGSQESLAWLRRLRARDLSVQAGGVNDSDRPASRT